MRARSRGNVQPSAASALRLFLTLLAVTFAACGGLQQHRRWESMQLSFTGPPSQSLGEDNPFALRLDVVFVSPDAREFRVPGFYAGDGARGPDGAVWQVRFSADQNGRWTYRTDSDHPSLDGIEGVFHVVDPRADAPDFYRWGRLEYVGEPYLKFRDGGYWVKAGADDPENILGEAMGDWASKRTQIDYIADKGINSIYVMTHNLDGDANDVWPWIGATSEEAKTRSDRFDIAKLEQWRDFFVYLQESGVALYMILEDDSAWTGLRPARLLPRDGRALRRPAGPLLQCRRRSQRELFARRIDRAHQAARLDRPLQPPPRHPQRANAEDEVHRHHGA